MTPLLPPSIHLNGTSKQEMVEGLVAVSDAAFALLEAMKRAAPNARDYYPQGPDAYGLARTAWNERALQIEKLRDEVVELAMKVTLA